MRVAGPLLCALAWCALTAAEAAAGPAAGGGRDYHLQAQPLAPGVWVFQGREEYFSRANGGDIANSGVILAPEGAIVIDTGSSLSFGRQLREAIRRTTGHDVIAVYNTHAHPDHFLGNQAFSDVPIAALPGTIEAIRVNGDKLADNLYRLVGGDMEGTQVQVPTRAASAGETTVGGRKLRLIAGSGHTDADLAVFDEASGTLFTGDLTFFGRTPATPNADLTHWLATLDALAHIEYRVMVPGHGPAVRGPEAIAQTREYLTWLRSALEGAAARGLPMPEVLRLPIPQRLRSLALAQEEFQRSVAHLYPDIEVRTLPRAQR